MSSPRYLAGVELGGTSCLAAVSESSEPSKIIHQYEVETTNHHETLSALAKYLKEQLKVLDIKSYAAIGIASFGPVDLREGSKTYGYITSTPKERWGHVEIVGFFKRELGDSTPLAFETDVNAPAMAEAAHEVAKNKRTPPYRPTVVYITVGTGVGVGVTVQGLPIHGLLHPEGGHMIVPKMPGDEYPGCCSFGHDCCVEGMVDSQAIADRVGVDRRDLDSIADGNAVWDTVGYYLGALCLNITYLLSPHVIVLGGGIMKRGLLFGKTRHWFKELLRGYLDVDKFKTEEGLADYIREPAYGNLAGIVGALELARNKLLPGGLY